MCAASVVKHLVLVFGERSKLLAKKFHFLLAKLFEPLPQRDNRRNHSLGQQPATETQHFVGDYLIGRVGGDSPFWRLS